MAEGIGSLWIGGSLSVLDVICLKSFVANGHDVTLFHYDAVSNVPDEVALVDAREIYDNDAILIHKNGSPAMHADVFRLHLMAKTDMIWVDTDMFCLKPFATEAGYAIARQTDKDVINCVMRLPKDSPALAYMLEFVTDEYPIPPWVLPKVRRKLIEAREAGSPTHVSQMLFTTFGPRLLKHALVRGREIKHVASVERYLPLPSVEYSFAARAKHLETITDRRLRPETEGIHLWHTLMKRHGWLDRIEPGSFLYNAALDLDVPLTSPAQVQPGRAQA